MLKIDTRNNPRLLVKSQDSDFESPNPGSSADPTVDGARLTLFNPATAETQTIFLDPNAWAARGKPPGTNGYLYRDRPADFGPCENARLRDGLFRILCRGALSYTLNEPNQVRIDVGFSLGDPNGEETVYCMQFGPDPNNARIRPRRDVVDLFLARNAIISTDCQLEP